MQDRVVRFITENSRISETQLRELMFRTGDLMRDIGTVLIGKDAVEAGLIDEVGGCIRPLPSLRRECKKDKMGKGLPMSFGHRVRLTTDLNS